LFFPGPNSRDLRSHRLGSTMATYTGLIPISLDAISITLRGSPLVKESARFLSVQI
jgi:hypothetical protein